MERLTERTKLGSLIQKSTVSARNMIDKLGAYEDAEEQGLLHKAPLKNGTPIWFFQYGFDEGTYLTSGTYLYGVTEYEIGEFKKDFWLSEEEALLANEEAEKVLKQMGERG